MIQLHHQLESSPIGDIAYEKHQIDILFGNKLTTSIEFQLGTDPIAFARKLRMAAEEIQESTYEKELAQYDGWRRNLRKFQIEWDIMKGPMKPHFDRFKRRWWDGHSLTNITSEADRLGVGYTTGHFLIFTIAALALTSLALAVTHFL